MTLVAEAVFARILSSLKDERRIAADRIGTSSQMIEEAAIGRIRRNAAPEDIEAGKEVRRHFVDAIRDSLYASKIVSYAQGFMLLRAAAEEYNWNLDYGRIASLWREGCIIRAAFLDDITAAFERNPDLTNLILDPFFASALERSETGWRSVITTAVTHGLPVPAYSTALAFFDGYRSESLPANLIQAQRDYFRRYLRGLAGRILANRSRRLPIDGHRHS